MQVEVSTFFGFKASVRKMTKECLVLTQVGNMELLHSKGGRSKWNLGKRDTLFLQSCPSSLFLRGLKQVFDRSEEHTSELQSLMRISYAVFCLKKKLNTYQLQTHTITI